MKARARSRWLLVALLVMTVAAPAPAAAASPARAEIRALWVDAFHAGIRSAAEARQLVADAKRLNVNTLFVQVRRRADTLYASSLEPPLDDPAYDPHFDALAFIVSEAHAAGLQVHAWVNAMPVWRDEAPPKDTRHVFNRHGPAATGAENWLTRSREGNLKFPVGYFLDPGHPAVRDYLVSVYLDIVRRYAVDGIHFDYIRYPETEPALPRGADVGYNPVSLARFRHATGTTELPAPDDERWIEWRRQQVTGLVRRISIEARAINPRIKVSAAVIAWGRPPRSGDDYANTAPMQRIFQDWRAWLREGLLDLAVPMNYAREHDPRVREWFNGWIEWEKRQKQDRQLAVGVGGYLSAPDGVLAQIERVRAGRGRHVADGLSIFSYCVPSAQSSPPASPTTTAPLPQRLDFLIAGASERRAAFVGAAPVPAMPWIERPSRGSLAGTATAADGRPVEAMTIRITRNRLFGGTRRTVSDANGWFGTTDLKPGRYSVRIDVRGPAPSSLSSVIDVVAGRVTRVPLPVKQ